MLFQAENKNTVDNDTDSRPPEAKKIKTEFCSDNSVSLPGILPGGTGPVGFEPGMFKNDDESSSHSRGKSKEKDKDKESDGASKVLHFIFIHIQINQFIKF